MKILNWKEGSGVFNEPDDITISLFVRLIRTHFFTLMMLNIIFVISCMPVITIGSATKALSSITMAMVRNKPIDLYKDYFKYFRQHFMMRTMIGLIVTVAVLMLMFSLFFYLRLGGEHLIIRVIGIGTFIGLLMFLMFVMYYTKATHIIDLDTKSHMINAFVLTVATPKALLVCTMTVFLPTYFLFTRLIVGLTGFILWQFSLNSLITSMVAYKVFKSKVIVKT